MIGHTPGPWELGEYEDALGYDCMTGGVKVGPVYLDGAQYGQKTCAEIEADQLARMMADARLIAAAPDLLEAAQALIYRYDNPDRKPYPALRTFGGLIEDMRTAIAKAKG